MRRMISSSLVVGGFAIAAFVVACLVAPASTLAQNAYITNFGSNTMSVIATATNAVTATISMPSRSLGVAVSPDGSRVYVTDFDSNSVSVDRKSVT